MSRKKKHPEHVNHERWLVSYADFITLLFAFFTTLYAISTVDQKKAGKLMYSMMTALNIEFFPAAEGVTGQTDVDPKPIVPMDGMMTNEHHLRLKAAEARRERARMEALHKAIQKLAKLPSMSNRVQSRIDARGVIISLADAGFFASGSAELEPGALPALDQLSQAIADQGEADLLVEGHTDNVPIKSARYASNWELSTARATFVVAFLLSKRQFDPKNLAAVGHGEFNPIDSNDNPAGRARNRRVDIVVRFSPTNTPDATRLGAIAAVRGAAESQAAAAVAAALANEPPPKATPTPTSTPAPAVQPAPSGEAK